MKKIISVLLAALMIMSCLSVVSFAEGKCTCGEGVHVDSQYCKCCAYCPNLNPDYLLACCDPKTDKFCCADCSGIYDAEKGCGCACPCCARGDQTGNENDSTLGDLVTEQDKENFVDGFQAIIKKLSDFFDNLFDTIFEFLKLDQVIGKGDR